MDSVDPTRQERVDAALADYMQRLDRGEVVDRDRFLAEHADIADELREYFEGSDEVEVLADLRSLLPAPADTVPEVAEDLPDSDTDDLGARGTRVHYFGDYVLLGEIARGGMGVVFRARQESLQRPAALKMVLSGQLATSEDLQRFRMEAQAAASLDHPNIVPIFEIGEHQGRHYFSMKLMDGGSLSDHLGRWTDDPRGAATIARKVARAVHFAHQRGILHRDLKPANILLDENGEPQVVDFGLAKRIDGDSALTRTRDLLGTPAYMAPEQTGGRSSGVTTQTDVYGLGAVLYGLLTGRPPFEGGSLLSTLEKVRDQVPEAPSRVNPRIPRDLEVICLRCLEKDPTRRYPSAEAVADDLDRWLAGVPIQARPVGPLARAWMWCRREPALAGMSAALLSAMFLGMSGIVVQWREAVHQRGRAETERNLKEDERRAAVAARERAERSEALARSQATAAETTLKFLADDVLGEADPDRNPRERKLTVEDSLDRAAAKIDSSFRDQPEVSAALRDTIGWSYYKLGAFEKAEPLLTSAHVIREKLLGKDHPLTLTSADHLASLLARRGRVRDAETMRRDLARRRLLTSGPDSLDTLSARNGLAILLRGEGKYEECEAIYREIVPQCERLFGPNHIETLSAMNNFANLLASRGRNQEAELYYQRVSRTREEQLGPSHPDTLTSKNNLGIHLQNSRKPVEAEALLREALEGRRRVYGPEHVRTLATMNNLAQVLADLGKLDEAESLHRDVLRIRRRDLGAENPLTLSALNNLGLLLHKRRQRTESQAILREVLEARKRLLGLEHPDTVNSLANLGVALVYWGEHEAALPLFRQSYQAGKRAHGEEATNTLTAHGNLASTLLLTRRFVEAESVYRKVLRLQSRSLGAGHPRVINSMKALAEICLERGNATEALQLLAEADTLVDTFRKSGGATATIDLSGLRASRAEALLRVGRIDEAEQFARDTEVPGKPRAASVNAGSARSRRDARAEFDCIRGACLVERGDFSHAEPLLRRALEALGSRQNAEASRRRALALEFLARLHDATGNPDEARRDRLLQADELMPARPFADDPTAL